MANDFGAREDAYRVTVKLDGADRGTWAKCSGGNVSSDDTTVYPGGMEEPLSLGGRRTYEALTVSKPYDPADESALVERVGKGAVTVIKTPLDRNRAAYGKPVTYTGTLRAVNPPDHNADGSDAAMLEIEVTVTGVA